MDFDLIYYSSNVTVMKFLIRFGQGAPYSILHWALQAMQLFQAPGFTFFPLLTQHSLKKATGSPWCLRALGESLKFSVPLSTHLENGAGDKPHFMGCPKLTWA